VQKSLSRACAEGQLHLTDSRLLGDLLYAGGG
jgi:hypothetical protein